MKKGDKGCAVQHQEIFLGSELKGSRWDKELGDSVDHTVRSVDIWFHELGERYARLPILFRVMNLKLPPVNSCDFAYSQSAVER